MQESHSQAYINCYVKYQFILYNLLGVEIYGNVTELLLYFFSSQLD